MIEIHFHHKGADDSDKPRYTVTITDDSTFDDGIHVQDEVTKKTEDHCIEENKDY